MREGLYEGPRDASRRVAGDVRRTAPTRAREPSASRSGSERTLRPPAVAGGLAGCGAVGRTACGLHGIDRPSLRVVAKGSLRAATLSREARGGRERTGNRQAARRLPERRQRPLSAALAGNSHPCRVCGRPHSFRVQVVFGDFSSNFSAPAGRPEGPVGARRAAAADWVGGPASRRLTCSAGGGALPGAGGEGVFPRRPQRAEGTANLSRRHAVCFALFFSKTLFRRVELRCIVPLLPRTKKSGVRPCRPSPAGLRTRSLQQNKRASRPPSGACCGCRIKLSVKIPSGGPTNRIGPSRTMAARSAVRDASFFQRLHPVAIGPKVCS
jgi:hypothetical protein